MGEYDGKVAIITGGASGIGKALAAQMAAGGARVTIADINEELAQSVVAEIGERASAARLDVADTAAVAELTESVAKEHGRLDYMFNNAGINVLADLLETTMEDWRRLIEINFVGVVNGVQAAYPLMARQGFGHIVNTGSAQGLAPAAAAYTAVKFGVTGLTNALRSEAAGHGVKVSLVCPGFTDTAIRENAKYVSITKEEFFKATVIPPMSPERCARKILRGVRRNRAIIPVSAETRLFWYAYRLAPALTIAIAGWVYRRQFAGKGKV